MVVMVVTAATVATEIMSVSSGDCSGSCWGWLCP